MQEKRAQRGWIKPNPVDLKIMNSYDTLKYHNAILTINQYSLKLLS